MRSSHLFAAGFLSLALAGSAHAQINFYANLSNDQELAVVVPTLSTGGARPVSYGTAKFTLAADESWLSYHITVHNIDFTGSQTGDTFDNLVAAHFHASSNPAFTPPATAGVVFGFFGAPFNDIFITNTVVTPFANGVGGVVTGRWDAPEGNNTTLATQLPNILAGRAYVNFHTVQYPGGEVRGAIQVTPEPASMLLLGSGLAGLAALRRRRRRK